MDKGLQVEGSSTGKIEVVISSNGAQLEGSSDKAVIGVQVRLVPDPLTPYNRFEIHRTATAQLLHFSFTGIPWKIHADGQTDAVLRKHPQQIQRHNPSRSPKTITR